MKRLAFSIILVTALSTAALAEDAPFVFPGWARYAGWHAQWGLTVADFNADGIPDVAVCSEKGADGHSQISLLFGQSDGSLGERSTFRLGTEFRSDQLDMAATDLIPDPEGLPDLILGASYSYGGGSNQGVVIILRNAGPPDYGFIIEETSLVAGGSSYMITTGDYNGDGLVDFAYSGYATSGVFVRYGQATGGFTAPSYVWIGDHCRSLESADLDLDGYCDIALTRDYGISHTLIVFHGSESGINAEPRWAYDLPGDMSPGPEMAIADFSNDGLPDIAFGYARYGWNPLRSVSVFYASENGGFNERVDINAGSSALIAAGDINGDGYIDLATATDYGGYGAGSVLYGLGSQGFSESASFVVGNTTCSLALADLNRDGRAEVLVTNNMNRVAILRQERGRPLGACHEFSVGAMPMELAAADFDKDGNTDLAVVNGDDQDVSLLWGLGDGSFERGTPDLPVGTAPIDIIAGHFDDDDTPDLAITGGLMIYHGDPNGSRAFSYLEDIGGNWSAIAAGYFDDDNRMDIALAAGSTVAVLHSQSEGNFAGGYTDTFTVSTGGLCGIASADLNGDGLADLAVLGGNIAVLYGQLDGSFGAFEYCEVPRPAGWILQSIAAGDVNGDGLIDLLATSFSNDGYNMQGGLAILHGLPGGGFGDSETFTFEDYDGPAGVAVADLDSDTIADIIVSNYSSQYVLLGSETGAFSRHQFAPGAYGPSAPNGIVLADFNNDGRKDLAFPQGHLSLISVMLNQLTSSIAGDVAVTEVLAPAAGVTGDVATVQWTVRNQRDTELTGKWADAVYFSRDQRWDIDDQKLGIVDDLVRTLAPNGEEGDSYEASLEVALPGVVPGDFHILVRADATAQIGPEDTEEDNVMANPIAMDLPEIIVQPANEDPNDYPGLNDTFTANSRTFCYKLEAIAGEDLLIPLETDANDAHNELYIRYGAVPTRSVYDAKYETPFDPNQTARIPGTQEGTYYVLAYADNLPPDANAPFNIRAEYLPFDLTDVTPHRVGDTGQVTITLAGSGFKAGADVQVSDGNDISLYCEKITLVNSGIVRARFQMQNEAHGTYDVSIQNPGGATRVLEEVIVVEEATGIQVDLQISGDLEPRFNQPVYFEGTITNNGNVDTPYLTVVAEIDREVGMGWERPEDALPLAADFPDADWLTQSPTATFRNGVTGDVFFLRDFAPGRQVKFTTHIERLAVVGGETFKMDFWVMPMPRDYFAEDLVETMEVGRNHALTFNRADVPDDLLEVIDDPVLWLEYWLQHFEAIRLVDYDVFPYIDLGPSGVHSLSMDDYYDCIRGAREDFMLCAKDAVTDYGLPLPPGQVYFGYCVAKLYYDQAKCAGDDCGWIYNMACSDVRQFVPTVIYAVCGPPVVLGTSGCGRTTGSLDPNKKLRLKGVGDSGFVRDGERLSYMVQFENLPDASAAALKIDVNDALDPNLDWKTLELEMIAFGETVIQVPDGLSHYEGRVDVNGWTYDQNDGWHQYDDANDPVMPLIVDVNAGIDIDTGVVYWKLECADPCTGYYPPGAAGFLPPNVEEAFYPHPDDPCSLVHIGEGYVTFSVMPQPNLPTGTEITNMASIVFDWNPAIDTNDVLNTIDANDPNSFVLPLPETTRTLGPFLVEWTGDDIGSGIAYYDIYVSDNGGDYTLWLNNTIDTNGVFTGEDDHTYEFYSVAIDDVGNREEPPDAPDAETTVGVPWPDLNDDDKINALDLMLFSEQWPRTDCEEANDWCSGADLDQKGQVDATDFCIIAQHWLEVRQF